MHISMQLAKRFTPSQFQTLLDEKGFKGIRQGLPTPPVAPATYFWEASEAFRRNGLDITVALEWEIPKPELHLEIRDCGDCPIYCFMKCENGKSCWLEKFTLVTLRKVV